MSSPTEPNVSETRAHDGGHWHRRFFEGRSTVFAVTMTIAVLIGGIVEIVPILNLHAPDQAGLPAVYTPLEQAGRDIFVREGCYNCHSQMVRPMYAETLRYGEWSRSVEYTWDRPFQLGSRRIGPDLAREGGLRNDGWHYDHFRDARSVSPGSLMPNYPWLLRDKLDPADVRASVVALARLGAPYNDTTLEGVTSQLQSQGGEITARLAAVGVQAAWDDEVIALIAYLQRLGTMFPADTALAQETP